MIEDELREAESIVARIRPLLSGRRPAVVGAALADLTAMWLTGHHVPGDRADTAALREELLTMHARLVRDLVALQESGVTPRSQE